MLRARVLSLIAWSVLVLWNATIRMRFVHREIPDGLRRERKNCIYVFWHGRLFQLFHSHRKQGIMIPASESRDGEIIAMLLKRFGYDVVRGSAGRKGDRALLGMISGLRKGRNVAIAADGPRGPLHEVKEGILYLAGKLGKPIIPAAASARKYWILEKTWEKLMIPAPFTKGVMVYGEPVVVDGISEAELTAKKQELDEALRRVTKEADEYFKFGASRPCRRK